MIKRVFWAAIILALIAMITTREKPSAPTHPGLSLKEKMALGRKVEAMTGHSCELASPGMVYELGNGDEDMDINCRDVGQMLGGSTVRMRKRNGVWSPAPERQSLIAVPGPAAPVALVVKPPAGGSVAQ